MKLPASSQRGAAPSRIRTCKRPASAPRVAYKRPAAASAHAKISKRPALAAAGLKRKHRSSPTTVVQNTIKNRAVRPGEATEDFFEKRRQDKLRKLGLHPTILSNPTALTSNGRSGIHYLDQDEWGCSSGGRDDFVRLKLDLEYGEFEMPALTERRTNRRRVAKPPSAALSSAGYPRPGIQTWFQTFGKRTYHDMLEEIEAITNLMPYDLDPDNKFPEFICLRDSLGKLDTMFDDFRNAGTQVITDLSSWKKSDDARVRDFILTCMPVSQGEGNVSVHCVNLAGEDFATLNVPAEEDPFGPWLLKELETLARDRPGRLRLADASGELFAMDVNSPTCLQGHQLSTFVIPEDDCFCDDCGLIFETGYQASSCSRCEYDLCADCQQLHAARANLRILSSTSVRILRYGHIWGDDDPVGDRAAYRSNLQNTNSKSEQHRLRQLLGEMKAWSYSDSMLDREETTIYYLQIGDSKHAAARLTVTQRVHRQCQFFNPFLRRLRLQGCGNR